MNKSEISRLVVTASAVVGMAMSSGAYAVCNNFANVALFPTNSCTRVNNNVGVGIPCVGTPGHDIIVGSGGNDVIESFAGNDVISTDGGNDVICSGPGDDVVDSGAGVDVIRTAAGNDITNSSFAAATL